MSAIFTSVPVNRHPQQQQQEAAPFTVIGPRDQGEAYWVQQELLEFFVTREQTGGAYDALRLTVGPGGGPPPHLHRHEDELFYVIAGQFEFQLGEESIRGGPGTCLFLPRNVIHRFQNVGETTGSVVIVATPSGFADFVREAGEPAVDREIIPAFNPAGLPKLAEVCERFDIPLLPDRVATRPAANPPAKPRELWVIGLHVKQLLTAEQTAGQMSVAELTVYPGDFVPPHLHKVEDEMFYVVDGTVWFEVGGESITATAGTFVRVRRGVMHSFRNIGSRPAKIADYHTPGGFEKFFEAAGVECEDIRQGPPNVVPNFARFAMICHDHGMELGEMTPLVV